MCILRKILFMIENPVYSPIMAVTASNMMKWLWKTWDAICFALDLLIGNLPVKYITGSIY